MRGQLLGHLMGQGGGQAAAFVDQGQLGQLVVRVLGQFPFLQGQVGALGIGLRADRHVFAGGHRYCAGDQAGHAGGQQGLRAHAAGGHAH